MSNLKRLIAVIAVVIAFGGYISGKSRELAEERVEDGVSALIAKLHALDDFKARVDYRVTLPMADDDVIYNIMLMSSKPVASRIDGDNYLIDWKLNQSEYNSEGFSAYFDGNFYRFRDHRLQEYHLDWDSIPFISKAGGVHLNSQFADLLPEMIARELEGFVENENFKVSFRQENRSGQLVGVVDAKQIVGGLIAREYRLETDIATGKPLSIFNEYNPGAISEQQVSAKYSYSELPELILPSSEPELITLYPELFERYRQSNYRIENMSGTPLPGFSLATLTGERYSRQKGESFRCPAVVAILDDGVATAAESIDMLRRAHKQSPREFQLILVFIGNDRDSIEEIVGTDREGETILVSGRSLSRDIGASSYPVFLIVDSGGNVENVMLGFNRELVSDVIQSIAVLN